MSAGYLSMCMSGDLEGVKRLLVSGEVIDKESFGWACFNGHLDVVKYLHEAGYDIHVNDDEAFRKACTGSKVEVVKYLVERGADIHANNDEVFRWANWGKHSNMSIYLQSVIRSHKLEKLLR